MNRYPMPIIRTFFVLRTKRPFPNGVVSLTVYMGTQHVDLNNESTGGC